MLVVAVAAAAAVSDDTPYFLAVVSKMAGAKNRVVHCAKNLVFAPTDKIKFIVVLILSRVNVLTLQDA